MDLASLLGIVVCFALVIFGILFGNDVSALLNFVDVPSMLITFGGAFCATLASKTMPEFLNGIKSISLVFKIPKFKKKHKLFAFFLFILLFFFVYTKYLVVPIVIRRCFLKKRSSVDCRRYRS